jgi:hypothetical protein
MALDAILRSQLSEIAEVHEAAARAAVAPS